MQIVKYRPAALGLGTESSSKLQPLDFAPEIINRFYNMLGDLEKRRGIKQYSTGATLAGLAEYVDSSGNSNIVPLETSVFAPYPSWVQMGNKLIVVDGVNRNKYYEGPGAVSFTQLESTIVKGTTGAGTTSTLIFDSDISNWKTQTNVAVNDLVAIYNNVYTPVTRCFAIITSVGTSSLDVTQYGTSATGGGFNPGISPGAGYSYKVIDLVENNLFIQTGLQFYDNVAIGGAATSALAISVTASAALGGTFDFSTSKIRPFDYVYNTTRGAVTYVTTVSSNISVVSVAGQTAGDSLIFLKDAMPIASYAHVHYGRLHLIDARDKTKIRVSGPNDPEDFTTFSKTLSSVTIDYGARGSQGDSLLTMNTFGRYLVVGGKRAVWVTDGTNPIADVTADVIDLDPVGLFPQGAFSQYALQNIGNEEVYIGYDGMRSFMAAFDSKNTTTNNKSEQLKTEIIAALQAQADTPENVQLIHYPRRNWVMMKIGSVIYNYNYTPMYSNGKYNTLGTFTKFTGPLAEKDIFLLTRSGDLYVANYNSPYIFQFDVSGVYTDTSIASGGSPDLKNIPTSYVSPWHTLQEAESNTDIIVKDGRYIRPVFDTSAAIKYTISVVGDYDQLATDSVVVTAAVSGITNPKMPLRWRGKQAQFTITTDTSVGGDILNSYTVYGNVFGRK